MAQDLQLLEAILHIDYTDTHPCQELMTANTLRLDCNDPHKMIS